METERFLCGVMLVILALLAQSASAQPPGSVVQRREGVPSVPHAQEEQRAANETRANQTHLETRSASGSMTGRVLADDGQPLVNAIITVTAVGAASASSRSVGTDLEGKFHLDGLAPGAYYLVASSPGYVVVPDASTARREKHYYRPGDSVSITMMKGGVITGTVTDSHGEPVVAISVLAIRVRNALGRTVRGVKQSARRWTDDRGVYRLYGLEPGSYLVAVRPPGPFVGGFAYEGEAPTYYPSATRDTATEVTVSSGQEVSAIDIRYRGEPGHTVSGAFNGGLRRANSSAYAVAVVLSHASSGAVEALTYVSSSENSRAFALNGVPDGDYFLSARITSGEDAAASPSRRIKVNGADVTGLELSLVPLGSIGGRVRLETAPEAERTADCRTRRGALSLEETVIQARGEEAETNIDQLPSFSPATNEQTPDAQGNFELRGLAAGRYHLMTWLPGDNWYVRAMTLPDARAPAGRPVDVARDGLTLKASERLQGVSVVLAEGASVLRGRVAGRSEGARLRRAPLRVHLVPAERENADATLRYGEATVLDNDTFAFNNIAPGRYWLIARVRSAESDSAETTPRPVAWDAVARARLRREAETANVALGLQPCQLITNYVLRYTEQPNRR